MVKKDCFGFEEHNEMRTRDCCAALQKLYCATGECRFYKSKSQRDAEEHKNSVRKERYNG